MPWFTPENTEGWSQDEIDLLNAAHAQLMDEVDEDTPEDLREQIAHSIGDRINNAWNGDITLDELVAAARTH